MQSLEDLENLNKEQNQQLKWLIAEKGQHIQNIQNAQSTNNELEQKVTSLKRVKLQLEKSMNFLEKLLIKRKPESSESIRENTSETLNLNDNSLSNTKQFFHKTKKNCALLVNLKNMKQKIAKPKETFIS